MKKLTNFLLWLDFQNIVLDDVKRILFKATQGSNSVMFEYPSANTFRDGDSIALRWTKEQTMLFRAGTQMQLDTFVELNGSDQNPETPILLLTMEPTLFKPEEVGV